MSKGGNGCMGLLLVALALGELKVPFNQPFRKCSNRKPRYFNTVGSKEGWTPSTFVSSRSNRKKDAPPAQQRAEDFMDEEDKADTEEMRKIHTADSFAGLGSTANEKARNEPFIDILKRSGDTMGMKLLRKMGWREGHGIGPKVRRKARLSEDNDPSGQDGQETHLFAPENSHMIAFVKKNDRKGLGFETEGRLEETSIDKESTVENDRNEELGIGTLCNDTKLKKKKPSSRGGFGFGVLNDTGSDDEDPYQMGPKISYNRIIGGDKKKTKKPVNGKTAANPLLNNKPVFISKKATTTKGSSIFRRCHDGRLPLDGFILSASSDPLSSILSQDGKYPPPTIPPGWTSSKTPNNSSTTPSSTYQSPADVAKASALDPKSRASLLGETPLPGKSVFDYLTSTARSRIATAAKNPHLPPALNEASCLPSSTTSKSLASLIPSLPSESAREALNRGNSGWLPYAEDPPKRTRYQLFLSTLAGLREPGATPERVPGASTEDWVNEMQEFAHAAQIFKPMSGMMATRFTSSSSTPQMVNDAMKVKNGEGEQNLLTRPKEKPRDPAEEAASLGMYGPMTRSIKQFYPTRLLCKRFNVKPPSHVAVDPGGAPERQSGDSEAINTQRLELVGKREMDELRREGGAALRFSSGDVEGGELAGKLEGELVENAVVVDPEKNEALEKERPGEDIFRAIFGDSDEN